MIDIKVYMPDTDQFEHYGYTVCPLIEELETDNDVNTHEFYVNSGIYSLPIYKGSPTPEIVDRLMLAEFPIVEMQSIKNEKLATILGNTTVIAKVIDEQRKLHFRKGIDEVPPSTRFLDAGILKTHTYKKITSGTQMKDLIPKAWKKDVVGFQQHMKKKFKEFMGI